MMNMKHWVLCGAVTVMVSLTGCGENTNRNNTLNQAGGFAGDAVQNNRVNNGVNTAPRGGRRAGDGEINPGADHRDNLSKEFNIPSQDTNKIINGNRTP